MSELQYILYINCISVLNVSISVYCNIGLNDEDKFHIINFFSSHVKSRDISRILKSCDISAV
jgi:hypothetical protein